MENKTPTKPKRIKWNERTPENDIKISGWLTYRHIRIIGWICMAISMIASVMAFNVKIDPSSASALNNWIYVFSIIASLPIPLFLLANFSMILQGHGNYKMLFIRFGILAGSMYIFANVLVFDIGFQMIYAIGGNTNFHAMTMTCGQFLAGMGRNGYMLNMFIDLLLCVLLFYFMNYKPKTGFTGKKIILFRLLILLPIAYEIGSILIKYNIELYTFTIPSYVFFLLPSKPAFIFLAFIIIVFALKIGEKRHLKKEGNSEETLAAHLKTNGHAMKIAVIIAIVFAFCAIADLVVTIFVIIIQAANTFNAYPDQEEAMRVLDYKIDALLNAGMGGGISLALCVPIALSYNYRKTYPDDMKNRLIDLAIPIVGIAFMFIVLLQGYFQVFVANIHRFTTKLNEVLSEEESSDPASSTEASAMLIEPIKTVFNFIRYRG